MRKCALGRSTDRIGEQSTLTFSLDNDNHTLMAKVVVTFKLEEEIYSKLKEIAEKEGRGVSGILRESLTDWLQNKKYVSTPDFITL